jgi:hypothetical protein
VEQVEILLLLSDAPEREWTSDAVFKTIQSNISSVTARLTALHEQGFLTSDGGKPPIYRYAPKTSELADGVALLKTAYRESHVKVIEAIYADPMQQARNFADSFRFRKD